ncbi:hypothetical protein [Mycobacterium tuberculosis]|uniref:hypothetical protein n=1 Tax=Mycobacterium tuberculosis TaxID=1773 RepID=UPI00272BD80B|nr:hypothetical protein [Mycobacterium tuberculosis]
MRTGQQLAGIAPDFCTLISPSCARIFTHKLPALFPADTDIQRVKDAFWAPTEYLVALHGEGALRIDFVNTLGKVNYHEPFLGGAHLGIARHTETLLGLVPDTKVNVVKGSPGFGSHWGNQREDYPVAIKLGSPSCARIFTHKLPALFPADTDIQRVKDAFWAPTWVDTMKNLCVRMVMSCGSNSQPGIRFRMYPHRFSITGNTAKILLQMNNASSLHGPE